MKPPSMGDEAAFIFFGIFSLENQGAGNPDCNAVPLGNLRSSDYEPTVKSSLLNVNGSGYAAIHVQQPI